MDPLYHSVSGIVLSQAVSGGSPLAGIMTANLPDIIAFPPTYSIRGWYARKDSWQHFAEDMNIFSDSMPPPAVCVKIYQAAHSLYALVVVSALCLALFPQYWLIVSLGYIIHLLADIPSHSGDFATRLLYPLSDWHVTWGRSWMESKFVFLGMWGVLLIIAVGIGLNHYAF